MKVGWIGLGLFVFGVATLAVVGLAVEPHHIPPSHLPGVLPGPPGPPNPASNLADLPRLVLSSVLLVAALFVILTKRYSPQDKHWAYGTIGTLVGFWLKS